MHLTRVGARTALCMLVIAAIAVILFSLGALGQGTPDNFTKEAWRITAASYACKSSDDYSKLIGFIVSGDIEAGMRFVTPRTLRGDCVILQPGKVFIERGELFGSPCVRRRGDTDCFFTDRSNLEPVK